MPYGPAATEVPVGLASGTVGGGLGVGFGVGWGFGRTVGLGVGVRLGLGVGRTMGFGVGLGVGLGFGDGAGFLGVEAEAFRTTDEITGPDVGDMRVGGSGAGVVSALAGAGGGIVISLVLRPRRTARPVIVASDTSAMRRAVLFT